MATEVLPEAHNQPQTRSFPQRGNRLISSPNRKSKRGLILIGVLALAAIAAALIPRAISSPEGRQNLTHTILRGDLVVTVTEEGRLESSENIEIKSKVRGRNTIISIVESGSVVEKGEILVKLDPLFIEEQVSERTKYSHWSRSSAERSKANVEAAGISISAYEEGSFRSQLLTLEKDLAIAKSNQRSVENMLSHSKMMASRGYISGLRLEEAEFAVRRAKLNVEGIKTEISVLKNYVKEEQMQTLNGNYKAAQANHKANAERAFADDSRRKRAVEELQHCVIKAERSGMVVHPSLAAWKTAPLAEGTNVHKDQVLLLMPDLSKMQVKVGISESIVGQITPGLTAKVTLPGRTLEGTVTSVATVAEPAAWWNGNEVRYDTIIKLPSLGGLRPNMSAEVEVIITRHKNVLKIPVAAIVETEEGNFCWIETASGTKRRRLELGDSNDIFTAIKAGLEEGDKVVLNPMAFEKSHADQGKSKKDKEAGDTEVKEPKTESRPQSAPTEESASSAMRARENQAGIRTATRTLDMACLPRDWRLHVSTWTSIRGGRSPLL